MNDQAMILVRAMIEAAKADGQITRDEQEAIMKHVGPVTEADVAFLREEFSRRPDVKAFAWSVPLGMEEQVYAASLLAIQIDEQSEVDYLQALSHGLRLPPKRCNEIHRRFNAPEIF